MKSDGRRKTLIEKGDLREMYINEKLPISKIAKKYECAKNTICYWLKKYNIKQRSASESMKLFQSKKAIEISKEKLIKLYKNGLSINNLSKEFNCSNNTILKRLREYKITNKFSNCKRINFDKKELKNLYLNKKLNTYKISDMFGCCQATIWKRLKEFNIKRRNSHELNSNIPCKKLLKKLYNNQKLSTWKIEKKYGYDRSTVHRKLKKYGIKIRDRADSHMIYPKKDFSGDSIEKSYLIGFKIGDLRVRKIWKNSKTIIVDCASSIPAQIKLINNLFKKYGKVWIKKNPNRKNYIQIEARLNPSFSFLLPNNLPKWILKNKKYFFSFLSGFTDAEGTISITGKNLAYYSIINQNKNILTNIRNNLLKWNIDCPKMYLNSKKGTPRVIDKKIYYSNKDCWILRMTKKKHLLNLLNNLEPYLKHNKKVDGLKLAKSNILERNAKFGVIKNG